MKLDLDPSSLPMTSEEFEQLPEIESLRLELVEGNLLVMNAAYLPWHSKIINHIINVFLRNGREAFTECGIRIRPGTVRTCDVGVFAKPLTDLRVAYHDAAAFAIVVEVVSPESRTRDYIDKAREYAAAGIPEYWVVDEDPSSLVDGLVRIHRLALTDEGPQYRLERTVAVSALAAEAQ
jgi:Uma2 family endonuclease